MLCIVLCVLLNHCLLKKNKVMYVYDCFLRCHLANVVLKTATEIISLGYTQLSNKLIYNLGERARHSQTVSCDHFKASFLFN